LDLLIEKVQVAEMTLQHHPLVGTHEAVKSFLWSGSLLPKSSFRQRSQFAWVFDAPYHGLQHGATGYSHYITGHGTQFDVGSLENLLDAIDCVGTLPNEPPAVAYQFAQFSEGTIRDKAGPNQSMP
jgi:hypothetical protein